MGFAENLNRLIGNPRIVDRLPPGLTAGLRALYDAGIPRSGSLLRDHLHAGCTFLTVPSLYLNATLEEDVVQTVTDMAGEGAKPPAAWSIWYDACKVFTMLCRNAISAAPGRRLPNRVRLPNLQSGAADVIDLPDAIASMAFELLEEGGEAADDCAAALTVCIARLFDVDGSDRAISTMAMSQAGLNRFFNEITGAYALYLLGVCPEHRLPDTLINRVKSKRESELRKRETLATAELE